MDNPGSSLSNHGFEGGHDVGPRVGIDRQIVTHTSMLAPTFNIEYADGIELPGVEAVVLRIYQRTSSRSW